MSSYSTSLIPSGIQILPSAIDFPAVGLDGQQLVAADTNTIYIYQEQAPAGWKPVANPGAAIAIDALTGEVTATGPGVVAATITNAAVTNAKLAAMADNTVKGNKSGAPASPSDLALSNVTEAVSSVLTISNGSKTVVSAADLTIEVKQSSAVQSGYLSSGDWSTFSNKVSSVGATAPIASSGGTTPTISISQSGVATDGYLSSADWNTFNSKQPAGSYITALTGEVTATGPGSVAATIAANAVTNAKLAKMAANTIKGNNTAGPSDPLDLTTAQTTAMLDVMVGDSGAGGTKGLVPAPVTGDATKYLRGDATWQTISLLPAYSQDKVLYSTASAAEWRTVGLGSTDSTYPTGCVILGTTKPSGLTGSGAQNSLIVGATAGAALTSATPVTLLNGGSALTSGGNNILIGAQGNTITSGDKNVVIGSGTNAWGTLPANINQAVILGDAAYASGEWSTAVGYGANSGSYTVAVGRGAQVSASYSVGIGVSATCYTNSEAVAIGYQANGRSANGVAIGSVCSNGTDASSGNIVIGRGSGKGTLSGNNNTTIGTGSFNSASLTTAANNTIVGQGSGVALTNGNDNIIIGKGTANVLSTGSANIFIGNSAGTNGVSTGSNNVLIGDSISPFGVQRNNCVMIGRGAAGNGTDHVVIGYDASASGGGVTIGKSARQNDYSVVIGTSAGGSGAGTSVIVGHQATNGGDSQGNVLIGFQSQTHPSTRVDQSTFVGSYTGSASATGYANTCIGYGTGFRLTSAANCVFLGNLAGVRSDTQSNELFIDNQDRTNYATQQTNSLIYGVFNATPASQTLTVNAVTTSTYGYLTALGSVSAPTYSFTGDTNTGLWSSAADTVNLSTGGSERLRVDSTGVVRINTTALIGTNVSEKLEIKGVIKAVGTDASNLGWFYAMGDGTSYGGGFQIWKDNSSSSNVWAIAMQTPGSSISDDLVISNPDGGWHECLRIKKAGDVIINETGASVDVRIEGDTDANLLVTDGSADKVGIGTATPQEKLDVNGTAQATAFQVPNYILSPQLYDIGTKTVGFTFDLGANGPCQQVTINAAGPLIITLSNPVTGGAYLLKLVQGATPGTVTWPGTVKWGTAGAPTLSAVTGKIDIINLYWDGTNYYGTYALGY